MTIITVFLTDDEWGAEERTYTDSENQRFDFKIDDGHLFIRESRRLIPNRSTNWKSPHPIRVFPPKAWTEVSVDYGS